MTPISNKYLCVTLRPNDNKISVIGVGMSEDKTIEFEHAGS
jgi:hypothetical protein